MKGKDGDDAPGGGGSGAEKKSALDKLREAKPNLSYIPATPASFEAQQAEMRNQTKAGLDAGSQFLKSMRGDNNAPEPITPPTTEHEYPPGFGESSTKMVSAKNAAEAEQEREKEEAEEQQKKEAIQEAVVEGDIEVAKAAEQRAKDAIEDEEELESEIGQDEEFDAELKEFVAGRKEFEKLSVKAKAAAWEKAQEQGSDKGPMELREARAKDDQIKNDEAIARAMQEDELAAAATPQPITASVGTQTDFSAAGTSVDSGVGSNVTLGDDQEVSQVQSGGRRAVDFFGGPGFSSHPDQSQGSEFDAITNAIQNQVLIPQQLALYSEYYKDKPELLHDNKLVDLQKFRKEVLSTQAGRNFVAEAMQDKAFQAKMHGIESSGYSRVHQEFAKQLRDIEWSKGNKENQSVIKNKKGEEVCTLKETTISQASSFTLAGGKSKSVKGYRKIDFPAQLDKRNGPMHLSIALRDEAGENMSEDGAIYFTAHYNKQGQLTEVSSPVPIKFMGKESDKDAIGYIERDGHIYTLPVTRGNYESMMMEVQKQQGLGVDMSQGMSKAKSQARDLVSTVDAPHHGQYQQQTMSQHLSDSVGPRVTSSALQMQPQGQNPRSPLTPDALLRRADQAIYSAQQQVQVMQQRPAPAPNVDAAIASWRADTQAQRARLETAVTLQDRLQKKTQSSKRKKLSQKEHKQLAAAEVEAKEALAAIHANGIKEAYLRDTLESRRQVPGQEGVDIEQARIDQMNLHYTPGSSNLKTAELLVKSRAAEREAEQKMAAIAAVAEAGLTGDKATLYNKKIEHLTKLQEWREKREAAGEKVSDRDHRESNLEERKRLYLDSIKTMTGEQIQSEFAKVNKSIRNLDYLLKELKQKAAPGDLNASPPVPPKPINENPFEAKSLYTHPGPNPNEVKAFSALSTEEKRSKANEVAQEMQDLILTVNISKAESMDEQSLRQEAKDFGIEGKTLDETKKAYIAALESTSKATIAGKKQYLAGLSAEELTAEWKQLSTALGKLQRSLTTQAAAQAPAGPPAPGPAVTTPPTPSSPLGKPPELGDEGKGPGGQSSDLLSQIQAGKALRKTPTPTPAPEDPNKEPNFLDQIEGGVKLKQVDQEKLAQEKAKKQAAKKRSGLMGAVEKGLAEKGLLRRDSASSEPDEEDLEYESWNLDEKKEFLSKKLGELSEKEGGVYTTAAKVVSSLNEAEVNNLFKQLRDEDDFDNKEIVDLQNLKSTDFQKALQTVVDSHPEVGAAAVDMPSVVEPLESKGPGVDTTKPTFSPFGNARPIAQKSSDGKAPTPPPRLKEVSQPMTTPEATPPGGAAEVVSGSSDKDDFKQKLASIVGKAPGSASSTPKPETKLTPAQEELKTLYEQFYDKQIRDARIKYGEGFSQVKAAKEEKQNAINSIAGLDDEAVTAHIGALQDTMTDWHNKAVKTQKDLGFGGVQTELKKKARPPKPATPPPVPLDVKGAAAEEAHPPASSIQGAAESSPDSKKSQLPPPPLVGSPSNQAPEVYRDKANKTFSPPDKPPPPLPPGADATLEDKKQVLKDYVSQLEGLDNADKSLYQNANKGLDGIDETRADDLLGKTANPEEFKKSLQGIVPPPDQAKGAAEKGADDARRRSSSPSGDKVLEGEGGGVKKKVSSLRQNLGEEGSKDTTEPTTGQLSPSPGPSNKPPPSDKGIE